MALGRKPVRFVVLLPKRAPVGRVFAGFLFPGLGAGSGATAAAGEHGSSGKLASADTSLGKPRGRPGGGILGAHATKVLPGSGTTQVALLIILVGAIVLLAIGAVPRTAVPHPAAAAFLSERRAVFAGAGLAALAAFVVSYILA